MEKDTMHAVELGHCVSAIRKIMIKNNCDVDMAFNIFKKDDYAKTKTLSKFTEEKFEKFQENIKKAVIDYDIKEKNKENFSWSAIGKYVKAISSIIVEEKKNYEEAFELFSNSQFKQMFIKYTIKNLRDSKEKIKSKADKFLPASFSSDDSKDVQYVKGGKKRFNSIEELAEIDLSDVQVVLKKLKDILSANLGRSSDKIRMGQMENSTSNKKLPRNSFSMIFSFGNLENRDKFLKSEEFQLLCGAFFTTAIRYNCKEALTINVP